MDYIRYAARRLALTLVSVYAVATVAVVATYPILQEWVEAEISSIRDNPLAQLTQTEQDRLVRLVREQYDPGRPLLDHLTQWWVDLPTLDWGDSITHREPVTAVLADPLRVTLEYVLPGLLLAGLLGLLLGVAIAVTRSRSLDWGARLVAYATFAVPAFMVLTYLLALAGMPVSVAGRTVVLPGPGPKTLAAIAVALALLGGQLRFARAGALELRGRPFVKTLLAKGTDRRRLARHLCRNLAVPFLSMSLAELLGTLAVTIYVVESVLDLDGLGAVTLQAAADADMPLLIGSVLLVVFLGLALRLCRDLVAGYLDPRTGEH